MAISNGMLKCVYQVKKKKVGLNSMENYVI